MSETEKTLEEVLLQCGASMRWYGMPSDTRFEIRSLEDGQFAVCAGALKGKGTTVYDAAVDCLAITITRRLEEIDDRRKQLAELHDEESELKRDLEHLQRTSYGTHI